VQNWKPVTERFDSRPTLLAAVDERALQAGRQAETDEQPAPRNGDDQVATTEDFALQFQLLLLAGKLRELEALADRHEMLGHRWRERRARREAARLRALLAAAPPAHLVEIEDSPLDESFGAASPVPAEPPPDVVASRESESELGAAGEPWRPVIPVRGTEVNKSLLERISAYHADAVAFEELPEQ